MSENPKRYLIIGAGFAGQALAKEIGLKPALGQVAAFVDDDAAKIGSVWQAIPVRGPLSAIEEIRRQTKASEAIIALPGAGRQVLRRVHALLERSGFNRITLLPGASQILDGEAHYIQTREITPEDVLLRQPITIALKQSLAYLRDRRVLITGAGGSIGSELSRQLLSAGAQRLFLFDNSEYNLYEIEKELRLLQEEGVGEKTRIVPVLGELKDSDFLNFIIPRLRSNVVFHCAAYKHVPMLEENPIEGVRNNVFGSKNLMEIVAANGCDRLVVISTDKAVRPTSIYGATKYLVEEMILNFKGESPTCFMVVRFGNVLGSQGSILPLFREQIQKGGPVTITDSRASRYFMTIAEAASLVLQAGGVGEDRGLYLLDMGEPRNILELACQMIRFYGYRPYHDIPIKFIGARPGEKLHENLWLDEEEPTPSGYPGLLRLKPDLRLGDCLDELWSELTAACYPGRGGPAYRNRRLLRSVLRRYVPSLEEKADEPQY